MRIIQIFDYDDRPIYYGLIKPHLTKMCWYNLFIEFDCYKRRNYKNDWRDKVEMLEHQSVRLSK